MKALKSLDNTTLLALKTALDAYQQYDGHETAAKFKRIVYLLIGETEGLDIWTIRSLINAEDERRSRVSIIHIINPDNYKQVAALHQQEQRILKLIAEGHKSEEIADLLCISYSTISSHKTNIANKLGLGSARALTKFAIENLHLF